MNLSNLLKNKKVKYFMNILLILTVLFSFITTILISTLLNGAVQPELIVILISSSVLLLLNLVLSRFVKNKVLLLIINLVLCVALISSSIALFVNLQKFKTIEGFQTVSEAQANVDMYQMYVDSDTNQVSIYQSNINNNISDIQKYLTNNSNIINETYNEADYMDITILQTKKDNNNILLINENNMNIKSIYKDYVALLDIQISNLNQLNQTNINLTNNNLALTQAKIDLENATNQPGSGGIITGGSSGTGSEGIITGDSSGTGSGGSGGAGSGGSSGTGSGGSSGTGSGGSGEYNNKIKALEGVSYITATTSIVSGITIALTNLLMFSGKH